MPSFIELKGYLNKVTGQVAWAGPQRYTPIPKSREEMEAQLDSLWPDLRKAMLDHAFPQKPAFSVGDETRGTGNDD